MEWPHSLQAKWNPDDLRGTVAFAAERIMEMLPPDHIEHMEMQGLLRRLEDVNIAKLHQTCAAIYEASFGIHAAAIAYVGPKTLLEWNPVIQEYQAMISCAARFLSLAMLNHAHRVSQRGGETETVMRHAV